MNKKSEIQSKTVMYILIIVIILILLIAFLVFIKNLREKQRRALLEKLAKDIQETVETLDFGSKEEKCLDLPENGAEVCFFDISKRETILKSPLINRYNLIKDSIEAGVLKNLFIISNGKVEPFYVGEICLDHYPYYSCIEVPENRLCIFLEGKGRCALVIQDLKFCYKPSLAGDTITEDFILGSSYARLSFKKDAILTYPGTEKELCIEPVYFPAESLLSEVYNLTPISTGISPNSELTMRYFTELLGTKDDTSNIKIKQFDTTKNQWSVVHNIQDNINKQKLTIKENINKLSYVGAFGPEAPVAVIKLKDALDGTELKKSLGGTYIVSQGQLIEFDASASTDADNDIDTYSWSFGDAFVSTGIKASHAYTGIGSYVITLTVNDKKGNKGTEKANIHIIAVGNVKNPVKYADNPIFFVDDSTDTNNILRLIPIAMWDGFLGPSLGIFNYPLLVYHKETSSLSAYNLDALKAKYTRAPKNPIMAFGNVPAELIGAVTSQSFDTDYFTYWNSYNEIVLVSQNNLDAGLTSALYASFLNAPLFFIPDTISTANKDQYCQKITGRTAYLVESNIDIGICAPQAVVKKTLTELRDPQINPYTRLHSNFIPAGGINK